MSSPQHPDRLEGGDARLLATPGPGSRTRRCGSRRCSVSLVRDDGLHPRRPALQRPRVPGAWRERLSPLRAWRIGSIRPTDVARWRPGSRRFEYCAGAAGPRVSHHILKSNSAPVLGRRAIVLGIGQHRARSAGGDAAGGSTCSRPPVSPAPGPRPPRRPARSRRGMSSSSCWRTRPTSRHSGSHISPALPVATRLPPNYTSVANPSLPNYLAMSSGSTWGIGDDALSSVARRRRRQSADRRRHLLEGRTLEGVHGRLFQQPLSLCAQAQSFRLLRWRMPGETSFR